MHPLLIKLRKALTSVADPERAAGQQAYMKSAMPYHGVSSVPLRQVCKKVFAQCDVGTFERWSEQVLALWRGAEFREERYAAIGLAGDRRARPYQAMRALPMYEEMIVSGAWWDYVDALASHHLGAILKAEHLEMRKRMREWSRCDDMWKRRSSIICQLGFKQQTDLKLLYACIAPSIDSSEFFLRKAIGWALRQYAWTDPHEVVRYVTEHRLRLSPLSKREALKNVLRQGLLKEVP